MAEPPTTTPSPAAAGERDVLLATKLHISRPRPGFLARREFLQGLMVFIAEHDAGVVLSSHLVSDLERVCDHLIVLVASRVRVAGEVEDLLASHYWLTGARQDLADLPAGVEVVEERHTDRRSTLIVRSTTPIDYPSFGVERLTLEDLVLAYMSQTATDPRPALETTP